MFLMFFTMQNTVIIRCLQCDFIALKPYVPDSSRESWWLKKLRTVTVQQAISFRLSWLSEYAPKAL